MKNRLKLDFSLDTTEERRSFVDRYLSEINWKPTNSELETIANYILWGKENGIAVAKEGNFTVETKHKTWTKKSDESLDALLEQPTFNEATLRATPTKIPKEKFSRKDALAQCPQELFNTFTELFRQIDELDATIGYYEYYIGKRDTEPREELLERFSGDELFVLRAKAADITQYQYLKMRHLLKELRDTQYTLRDSYTNQLMRPFPQPLVDEEPLLFDENVQVFPLGTINSKTKRYFCPLVDLIPQSFEEEELARLSKTYWDKIEEERNEVFFDFECTDHVGFLIEYYEDIEGQNKCLVDTLDYYISIAKLSDAQREILDMKIHKKTNQEIRLYINEKYEKKYMVNYISTIFRQKIIPAIVEAVEYHKEVIANLYFEENFKKCSCCGETMLISEHNFMHKARSKDGFSARCKKCEKEMRKK